MIEVRNFIGGEFVAAVGGSWLEKRNPATNEIEAKVVSSGHLDVVRALQAANKALPAWTKLEPAVRVEHLISFSRALEPKLEEIAQTQSRETGVPILSSRASVQRALEALKASARLYLTNTETSVLGSKAQISSHRLPVGVVGLIGSWSEAAFFLVSRLGAALVSGNCVIAKPSSIAPRTSELIAEIAQASGLPSGVFNLVQGRGVEIGRLMVEHPGISAIAFSGRTETGQDIQQRAAENLKRTQLALGACNSVLVFAETDLEKTAAKTARLCLTQTFPQSFKGTRLFVQESVYKRFLELFEAEAEKIAIGDPLTETTQHGPLVSLDAVAKHEAQITQALSEKGKLLFGGQGRPENLDARLSAEKFVLPTAIYDLTLCSTLQQEEAFGPFCLVSSFKYQHDAIKHANTSPFGQVTHVFHANASKVQKIAQKLEAGRTFVNPSDVLWDSRLNYSGLKASGLGLEGTRANLDFFSLQTLICLDLKD